MATMREKVDGNDEGEGEGGQRQRGEGDIDVSALSHRRTKGYHSVEDKVYKQIRLPAGWSEKKARASMTLRNPQQSRIPILDCKRNRNPSYFIVRYLII